MLLAMSMSTGAWIEEELTKLSIRRLPIYTKQKPYNKNNLTAAMKGYILS